MFEKINENKEALKLNIQKIFTKIRNKLNEREDELLFEVEKQYENLYMNEDVLKKSAKLTNKIEALIEKGKNIKEWNDNDLISNINDCINIEKNINEIDIINKNVVKCKSNKNILIKFSPQENEIDVFLETIKSFGKIDIMLKQKYQNQMIEQEIEKPKQKKEVDLYPEKQERKYHDVEKMASLRVLEEEDKICDIIIDCKKKRKEDYEYWIEKKDAIKVKISSLHNQKSNLEMYQKSIKAQYQWESKLLVFVEKDPILNEEQKNKLKQRVNERKQIIKKELSYLDILK